VLKILAIMSLFYYLFGVKNFGDCVEFFIICSVLKILAILLRLSEVRLSEISVGTI
jgi:hypothetical protein